jgi:hypothetical protein
MALPGVPQTFAVENAQDMADKLYWEIEEYRNETDIQKKLWRGFNCAVTAWHITDWLWHEQKGEQTLLEFQNERVRECCALLTCRYIANASKHRGVARNKNDDIQVVIRATEIELGDWPQTILESQKSDHWEIVIITPQDETDAHQIFHIVQQYWDTLLKSREALAPAHPAASGGEPSGEKLEC